MRFATRRPWLTVVLIGLLTVVMGRHARHSRIDNRLEDNVLQDEQLQRYRRFVREFGNDRILIGSAPFTTLDAALLRTLFDVEEQLRATGFVDSIISPVSLLRETFSITDRAQFERWVAQPDRVAGLVRRLGSFTVLHGTIVSFEKKTVGIVIAIGSKVGDTDTEPILRIKRIVEGHRGFRGKMVVTGIPDIIRVIHQYTAFSQKVFTPATIVIISLVLWLLYRSVFGILAPLATVLIPVVWTLGLFNWLGNSTNFITSTIPPVLIANALTSCIHLVTDYIQRTKNQERFDAGTLVATVRELTGPILLCQLTTIFGFLSMVTNGLGAIGQYGVYSGIGVFLSVATIFFLLPALITIFRVTHQRVTWLQAAEFAVEPLGRFASAHRWAIVLTCGALTAVSIVGLTRLTAETSLIRYIPRHHPLIREIRTIEERTCGIVPIHLCLSRESKSRDSSLLDPAVCRAVAALETRLRKIPDVDSALSYVDLVQDYDRTFSREVDHIPPSAEEIDDYLDFFRPYREPILVEKPVRDASGRVVETRVVEVSPEGKGGHSIVDWFLTRDCGRAHIALRVRDVSSRELTAIFGRVEELARATLPRDVRFHLTGRAYLWAVTSEMLVSNQISNFFWSLATIGGVIVLYFRSLFLGVLALVPNVLPVLIMYGVMGFIGMEVNTVTAMLACVVIGMVVDDTIHYIHTFRGKIAEGLSPEDAVIAAFHAKGGSMAFMAIVLAAGFGVLMLSDFVPTFQFGLLTALTFLMAVWFDLLFTPAMLLVIEPFGNPGKVAGKD
ncbi:MAG: MMPL family transporter [Candidatus Riflebacteria bacterium]|nr:MMPL family transporter [Candidatus Riflebacteria bacterium]